MTTFDFTPLYRSAIGFDRLASLMDDAMRTDNQTSYPPYNVELVDENSYLITMAVAGFAEDEIDIEAEGDTLTITAKKAAEDKKRTYLHQGIAARSFERRFNLADHVKVVGASMENGLLHVELVREIPEAMKPRKIEIGSSKLIESNAA